MAIKRRYVGIVLALLLAGCGAGMGEDSTAEPTQEPAAAAAPSASPAASATARPTQEPAPSPTTAVAEAMPSATAGEESMGGMDHSGHSMGETVAMPIKLFMFKPDVLEVTAGTTIEWTNEDDIQHSVTHGTPDAPGTAFDSGFFTLGQSFSHTFDEAGSYPYFCMRHPSMMGTVEVR